jgi:hypothetical protein
MDYQKISESSGCVLFEKDDRVYIMQRPGSWTSVAGFIFLIIAIVLIGFGVFQLIESFINQNGTPATGLIFIAAGIITGFIFILIFRKKKQIAALSPERLKLICILDFTAGVLLDCNEKTLSPLSAVRIERDFQMTSSSPALAVAWPQGSIRIARGNPFTGGIAGIEDALKQKGL